MARAWGGDPARKQASIAAARAALAARPVVTCSPALNLAEVGADRNWSNVYCAAYGTADPADLEAQAGLPVSVLLLASAALCGCQFMARTGVGDQRMPELVGGAKEAPIAALEAIRAGADPLALIRNYVVDLLRQMAGLHDCEGRGLTPEQQALVRQLATLHDESCTDRATFRALRRTAMAATDTATGDLEGTVLRFVESVAWPLAGLSTELIGSVMFLHIELRSPLAPEQLSPAERATGDALSALYLAAGQRLREDPAVDAKAEYAKIETTPEFAAVKDPAFQDRLERLALVEAEAYAPFAGDLLIGAFRKA